MLVHVQAVTRAADLKRSAGMRLAAMPECRIDRDEYEATRKEMIDRHEREDGGAVIITGNHEDHGRVTLRREAGVFTIEAEDLSLVRPWGTAAEQQDD